jgi:hypothetical protein
MFISKLSLSYFSTTGNHTHSPGCFIEKNLDILRFMPIFGGVMKMTMKHTKKQTKKMFPQREGV